MSYCLYAPALTEKMNQCERHGVEMRSREKLRVAVLLDSEVQPAWLYAMLEKIKALNFVEFCLRIKQAPPALSDASPVLWRLYRYADDRLFGRVSDALAMRDVSELLHGVPLREIDLAASDNENFSKHNIDVVLDIVGGLDPAALTGMARYGIWRYEFGDAPLRDPSVVGRREVFDEAPLTVSRLLSHLPDGQVVCLIRSQSRTVPFSPRRNRDNAYWKSAAFASRALAALHQSQTIPNVLVAISDNDDARQKGFNMAAALARVSANLLGRGLQKLKSVDQWIVAFKFETEPSLPHTLSGFQSMMPPKDRFWADPFPIERDGRYFVFIEELPFATNKGYISVMEVRPDGSWTQPVKVLERDYHLSYPFLFEWQGDLFMLPETGQNRTVEVYRCHRFPDDWRLESVLLENVNSADATLAHIGDCWWMFVNIGEAGTELYDELHLYHADQPFGPWVPHRNNPVKSDARSARPAGNLFWLEGQLYRPAQCCVPLYGSALSLNRVECIDAETFNEQPVAQLTPDWRPGLLGAHTFNRAGLLTVVDGFQRTPRFGTVENKLEITP